MSITLPVEDYSPITQGDTGAIYAPVFVDINGAVPLTGITLSTRMRNQAGVIKIWSTSAWTIDDAANGKAHYSYQASDVDTPGTWTLQTTLTDSQGKVRHTDTRTLIIEEAI